MKRRHYSVDRRLEESGPFGDLSILCRVHFVLDESDDFFFEAIELRRITGECFDQRHHSANPGRWVEIDQWLRYDLKENMDAWQDWARDWLIDHKDTESKS